MRIFCPFYTLRRLHEISDRKHVLVDSPDEAELILVLSLWKNGEEIQWHELADHYPDKFFVISQSDLPTYMIHGVYTGSSGLGQKLFGRVRTGSFTLNIHKNLFVEQEHLGSGIIYPKKYLYSFMGRNSHPVRQALFDLKRQRKDILIEDTSMHFDLWDENRDKTAANTSQKYFCEVLKQSKFALCPRGICHNSIRLYEALKLGVAPVILADGWHFPLGPNWDNFSIVVREKHVDELERIVGEHESDFKEMGKQAALAYENWFSEQAYFNFLVASCNDIMRKQWVPERLARSFIRTGYKVQTGIARSRKRLGIRTRLRRAMQLGNRK